MNALPLALSHLSAPVLVHLVAALLSIALGAWQWLSLRFAPRITRRHRAVGYAWVAAMAVTALSSFGIKGRLGIDWLNGFSLIHGLSVFTLVALGLAVNFARQRKIEAHRRWMRASFAGLLVAGVLAGVSPGRTMNSLLFTAAPQALAAVAR